MVLMNSAALAQTAPAAPDPKAPAEAAPAAQAPAVTDEYGDEEDAIVVTGARPRGSVVGDILP